MSKYIFLDIETTGFSRQWNDIIEIAAIVIDTTNGLDIDSFHEYIKPRSKINSQITELTGITNKMVENCRSECSVLMDFSEWVYFVKPTAIIGHNCKSFDLNFIKAKCDHYGIAWDTNKINIIDTLALARDMNKQGQISTSDCKQPTLAKYFGIDYVAHSALEDVKALIKIYDKMTHLEEDVGF